MKVFYKVLSLVIVLISFGCQNDNESNFTQDQLSREWKFVKVTGGLLGVNQEIEPGMITWSFNSITNTVTIVNTTTDQTLNDFFETGVYNYQILESSSDFGCDEVVKIDNIELGCLSIVDDKLVIDQTYADGFRLELID